MNVFTCVPDCVVGLPTLEWLDMGSNRLQRLPEDIHRCEYIMQPCTYMPSTSQHVYLYVCPQNGEAACSVAAEESTGNTSRQYQQVGQAGHSGPLQQQTERHPPSDGGHVQPEVSLSTITANLRSVPLK